VAVIQIRNMPDDLKEALRDRARRADLTMSDYVIRLVRRDVSELTMEEWLERVRANPIRPDLNLTAAQALDEARAERERELGFDPE
jgi:plasmid stability protein